MRSIRGSIKCLSEPKPKDLRFRMFCFGESSALAVIRDLGTRSHSWLYLRSSLLKPIRPSRMSLEKSGLVPAALAAVLM